MLYQINDGTVSLGGNVILDHIDFEIRGTEKIAVTGANGAGKSTLARCICGLEKKCGLLQVDGKTLDWKARLKHCYMVMQDTSHQLFTESVMDEVLLSMDNEDETVADEILKQFDLLEYKDRHPLSLSGGQKQRVWIAMALAQDTKVLFLDEPTTYLDVRYQLQILKLIQKLNREYGITIVMVLHDINQSLYYSDEIVAMKDGRIIAHGLPEEIISKELVKEVYGVDLTIQSVDGKPFVIPV